MRVGTDGILLGSWVDVGGDERRILDIGCGTGLLALMMAQRNSVAHIDAVEIESLAAIEAQYNVDCSPWKDRIKVYKTSIQEFTFTSKLEKYDLIVSNPPYFINSSHNEKLARAAARHASLLTYSDLVDSVVSLLSVEGRFAAIFPFSEAHHFIEKASELGLHCTRKINVYPLEYKPIKRIIAEFEFAEKKLIEENITIETNDHSYTAEYMKLTSPFYLRF